MSILTFLLFYLPHGELDSRSNKRYTKKFVDKISEYDKRISVGTTSAMENWMDETTPKDFETPPKSFCTPRFGVAMGVAP